MFIAGMTTIAEPPLNDLWTIPGEEQLLAGFRQRDRESLARVDPPTAHYHSLQIGEFLRAALDGRAPAVTGEDGAHGRGDVRGDLPVEP